MRRRRAEKRVTLPDSRFDSKILGKFINMVMKNGKKSLAENIVYGSLDIIKEKMGSDPMEVFKQAMENARPLLEVKSRRIGGATYQVPIEVTAERGQFVAMQWIRDFSWKQKGKPMKERLADEIMNAYKKEGPTIKRREDTHRMAEANKAFAHYKW